MHLRQGLGGGPEKLQRLKYCKRERLPTVWNTGACCRDEFLLSGPIGVIADWESLQLTLIFII